MSCNLFDFAKASEREWTTWFNERDWSKVFICVCSCSLAWIRFRREQ